MEDALNTPHQEQEQESQGTLLGGKKEVIEEKETRGVYGLVYKGALHAQRPLPKKDCKQSRLQGSSTPGLQDSPIPKTFRPPPHLHAPGHQLLPTPRNSTVHSKNPFPPQP